MTEGHQPEVPTAGNDIRQNRTTLVILNPTSGRGRGVKLRSQLSAALNDAGVTHEIVETTRGGEGIELAQQGHADGYQTIVAAGGDGTVSEVVNGLAQINPGAPIATKVAVVSVGSGNDFAHAWNVAQSPTAMASAIARGETRPCDLGHVTIQAGGKTIERYFNNNFGTGLDSQVTLESLKIKRLQGVMLYGMAALRALWRLETPVVKIEWESADGVMHRYEAPISLVSVGNTPRSGGGFQLTPGAQMDDGLLDLGIADAMSRWQLLQLLPKALQGAHVHHPAFTLVQFKRLTLSTAVPLAIEMDGEVITEEAEQIEMVVQPARLQLIV